MLLQKCFERRLLQAERIYTCEDVGICMQIEIIELNKQNIDCKISWSLISHFLLISWTRKVAGIRGEGGG